jgi:spore coat protein CotF
MYRFVNREQVVYGHFKEYLEASNQLTEYTTAKGFAAVRLLMPTVGMANEAIWESEYESLADFEREMQTLQTDPEFMKLLRASVEHVVQGSSHSELLETMTDIA